jgi:hypothetical protein
MTCPYCALDNFETIDDPYDFFITFRYVGVMAYRHHLIPEANIFDGSCPPPCASIAQLIRGAWLHTSCGSARQFGFPLTARDLLWLSPVLLVLGYMIAAMVRGH